MQQEKIINDGHVVLNAALSHVNKTSLFDLCLQADLLVQMVMLLLVILSVWGWTIIFTKLIVLKSFKSSMRKFIEFFHTSRSINQLFRYANEKKSDHILAQILFFAVDEWQIQHKTVPVQSSQHTTQTNANTSNNNTLKERVNYAMLLATSKSIGKLENNIDFLATISSSAPFIGLFGTVWGVMSSFQSIALSKNTTLAVVAPGIAEALLATAFGLIAAIPAYIFYNKFSSDIDKISRQADDFRMELYNLILRELI